MNLNVWAFVRIFMQISVLRCHFTMWHGTFSVIYCSELGLLRSLLWLLYPCHSIMATIGKSTSIPIRQPSDKPCPGLILPPLFSLYIAHSEQKCKCKFKINRFVRCRRTILLEVICISFQIARVRRPESVKYTLLLVESAGLLA